VVATQVTTQTFDADDGIHFEVRWEYPQVPCDTAKEFEIEVTADAINAVADLHGKARVFISKRSAVVRMRGVNLRRHALRNVVARVTPLGRSSIICSVTRSVNINN
jgi:hypothetical protein